MNINYDLIGMNIQKHRERKGLSQAELGDRIDSSERHIRRIEGGHCGVSLNLLVSIANALDASVDDILGNNLKYSDSSIETQINKLFFDCNTTEKSILIDLLKHIKELLVKFGI